MKIVALLKYHYETRPIVDGLIARMREFAAGHEFVVREDVESFKREIADADVMFGYRITPEILACARRLRWIQFGSAGIDHTVFDELLESDITLTNFSGVHVAAVSEHVLALILGLTRRLDIAIRQQAGHDWDRSVMASTSGELSGRTIGIIGLGKIGQGIARLAKGFGMRVIGTKRTIEEALADVDEVYPPGELAAVLAQSDFLVLVVPLTGRTQALIGRREIEIMPDGAFLINVARGAMIDHDALGEALASGKLAGAGLDVFPREPLTPDSPIWDLPNTIITPHTGGASPGYSERGAEVFRRNLEAFVTGGEMINVYDRERGY